MGCSHTPYMFPDMTRTTKITLSLSPVDTTFVAVSFLSPPRLTLFICLPIRQTPPLSLSHTQNSLFRTLPRISHTKIYRLASR